MRKVIEIEMEGREVIIDTFGIDTDEWREARMKYWELKEDFEREISLSPGSDGVRKD